MPQNRGEDEGAKGPETSHEEVLKQIQAELDEVKASLGEVEKKILPEGTEELAAQAVAEVLAYTAFKEREGELSDPDGIVEKKA